MAPCHCLGRALLLSSKLDNLNMADAVLMRNVAHFRHWGMPFFEFPSASFPLELLSPVKNGVDVQNYCLAIGTALSSIRRVSASKRLCSALKITQVPSQPSLMLRFNHLRFTSRSLSRMATSSTSSTPMEDTIREKVIGRSIPNLQLDLY